MDSPTSRSLHHQPHPEKKNLLNYFWFSVIISIKRKKPRSFFLLKLFLWTFKCWTLLEWGVSCEGRFNRALKKLLQVLATFLNRLHLSTHQRDESQRLPPAPTQKKIIEPRIRQKTEIDVGVETMMRGLT